MRASAATTERPAAMPTASAAEDLWWLVGVAGVLSFLVMLGMSIVNVALPTIARSLGGGDARVTQWVVLGYLLPLIVLVMPSGRWLDTVGRRPALMLSVAGFATSCAVAGMAPSIGLLIAARVVQGSFGAIIFSLMPVLAAEAVRPEARARAMSVLATLGPLGAVSGPVMSTTLFSSFGWRSAFLVQVPICVAVIGIGLCTVPGRGRLHLPDRCSTQGALVLVGALSVVLLALTLGADGGWWLALTLAAVPLLVAWSRLPDGRQMAALMRTGGLGRIQTAVLALAFGFAVMNYLIPFHLRRDMQATVSATGVVMLAFPLGMLLAGPLAGYAADRWGTRRVGILGAGLMTAGVALVAPLAPSWSTADLWWRLGLSGLGMGLYGGPVQALAMSAAPSHLFATTGSAVQLARGLGFAMGPAVATAVWSSSGYASSGMRTALGVAVAAGCLAVTALALHRPSAVGQSRDRPLRRGGRPARGSALAARDR